MTYAMMLDNAWELMTEDEMYDVNGGFWDWLEDRAWALFDGLVLVALGWMASSYKAKYGTIKGLYGALKAGKLGQGLVWLAGTIKAGIVSATTWVIANPLLALAIGSAVVGTVVGAIAIFL